MDIKYIIILFVVTFTSSVRAEVLVFDMQSLAKLKEQLKFLKRQTDYLQKETKYLKQELKALNPNQYKWHDVEGSINNLNAIMNHANGLSYASKNINEQFKDYFPGYQFRKDLINTYKKGVNKTQNTLHGILQTISESAKEFKKEKQRIIFFQHQIKEAVGQMQAIQVSSQMLIEMISQLQMLRQTMITQINSQSVYYAHQVQTMSNAKEELAKIIDGGTTKVPSLNRSGNPITIPELNV